MNELWDTRFLGLAKYISTFSKDPSTKTGAVITEGSTIISQGYNGFPRGIADDERLIDRALKLKMIIHSECNAILYAARPLHGLTIYSYPFAPCSSCAAMIIQVGITRCIAPELPDNLKERWGADLELSALMFEEAGVELTIL